MQNLKNENVLRVKIVTPDNEPAKFICDSVNFKIKDGQKGNEGGAYGVRPGHTKAVFTLDKGEIVGFLNGDRQFSYIVNGGFARLENNNFTFVCESITQ